MFPEDFPLQAKGTEIFMERSDQLYLYSSEAASLQTGA